MGRSTSSAHIVQCAKPIATRTLCSWTQVLNHLDVVLPAEQKHWWRRQVYGETPHLALLSVTPADKYRGPIWTEDRYSSGKPVTARVLVSARGDFLIEIALRQSGGGDGRHVDGRKAVFAVSMGRVIRLEVMAHELRTVFRGLDKREELSRQGKSGVHGRGRQRSMECLLAPDRRAELCR